MRVTIKSKCVASQSGAYTVYVFENLSTSPTSLVTTTQCPHWNGRKPSIGEVGFLEYDAVEAGEGYTSHNGNASQYNYTANYFIGFVPETPIINNNYDF